MSNEPSWKKAARRTAATLAIGALMGTEAMAGGLTLYEVGTAEDDPRFSVRIREGLPRMSLDLGNAGVTQ